MSDRSDKWHATRRAREAALFAGRKFVVVREIKDTSFKTPLGYSAKNGYEVRNVETGETFMVGKTTLKVMAQEYDAVTLPAPKKRGRPKKNSMVYGDARTASPVISQNKSGSASGGIVFGPRDPQDDTIPAVLTLGHVVPAYLADKFGPEVIERMNAMSTYEARKETEFTEKIENGNEPGAHPVSEPNDDNDRSGTLAGPTYDNPNADEHATEYEK